MVDVFGLAVGPTRIVVIFSICIVIVGLREGLLLLEDHEILGLYGRPLGFD